MITMPIALTIDPEASTTEAIRPSMSSEVYSAGPNWIAIAASGGANRARIAVAIVPAKNEAMAAVASASPARPCRAIL